MFPPEETCSKHGKCHICYHIAHLCKYRFALEETYLCIIFALCKFGVNPFFCPVKIMIIKLKFEKSFSSLERTYKRQHSKDENDACCLGNFSE